MNHVAAFCFLLFPTIVSSAGECPVPSPPSGGTFNFNGQIPAGTTLSLTCKTGFTADTTAGTAFVCNSDASGKYDVEPSTAVCNQDCAVPTDPHGSFSPADYVAKDGKTTLTCEGEYYVGGKDTVKTKEFTCTAGPENFGTAGPTLPANKCLLMDCQPYTAIANGKLYGGRSIPGNRTRAFVECDPGYFTKQSTAYLCDNFMILPKDPPTDMCIRQRNAIPCQDGHVGDGRSWECKPSGSGGQTMVYAKHWITRDEMKKDPSLLFFVMSNPTFRLQLYKRKTCDQILQDLKNGDTMNKRLAKPNYINCFKSCGCPFELDFGSENYYGRQPMPRSQYRG